MKSHIDLIVLTDKLSNLALLDQTPDVRSKVEKCITKLQVLVRSMGPA